MCWPARGAVAGCDRSLLDLTEVFTRDLRQQMVDGSPSLPGTGPTDLGEPVKAAILILVPTTGVHMRASAPVSSEARLPLAGCAVRALQRRTRSEPAVQTATLRAHPGRWDALSPSNGSRGSQPRSGHA